MQLFVQIFYHNDHDMNSFRIEQNGHSILQCTTTTYSHVPVTKANTCYTSGIALLRSGDNIQIADFSTLRYVIFDQSKSFFGLIRLGDVRSTTQPTHPQSQYELVA